jgi:hypothetical protein
LAKVWAFDSVCREHLTVASCVERGSLLAAHSRRTDVLVVSFTPLFAREMEYFGTVQRLGVVRPIARFSAQPLSYFGTDPTVLIGPARLDFWHALVVRWMERANERAGSLFKLAFMKSASLRQRHLRDEIVLVQSMGFATAADAEHAQSRFEHAHSWTEGGLNTLRSEVRMYYSRLSAQLAFVYLPYNIVTLLLLEVYAMNVPIFVPSARLWRKLESQGLELMTENIPLWERPLQSPAITIANATGARFPPQRSWYEGSDQYTLPYISAFDSFDELMLLLRRTDLHAISERMSAFNQARAAENVRMWASFLSLVHSL